MSFYDTLEAGAQIDSYRIEAPVARSGMASIFRAVDTRDGRIVALKIPHPDMEADPILSDRFQREAGIGEKLDHPKVMRVFGGEERSRIYGDGVV
jgi:serine/threonine protein kinase